MITAELAEAARAMTPNIETACELVLVLAAAEKQDPETARIITEEAHKAALRIIEFTSTCLIYL